MILLVEDSHADALALEAVLRVAKVRNPVTIVTDGEQAIQYLKGIGQFADRSKHPLPSVILLDLKMPRVDGFEVLQWIKRNPLPKKPLVVVLSGYDEAHKLNLAYTLGANSFLVKPCMGADVDNLLETYPAYWVMDSKPPPGNSFGRGSANPGVSPQGQP